MCDMCETCGGIHKVCNRFMRFSPHRSKTTTLIHPFADCFMVWKASKFEHPDIRCYYRDLERRGSVVYCVIHGFSGVGSPTRSSCQSHKPMLQLCRFCHISSRFTYPINHMATFFWRSFLWQHPSEQENHEVFTRVASFAHIISEM